MFELDGNRCTIKLNIIVNLCRTVWLETFVIGVHSENL